MNLVLFDDPIIRINLLPFTFTRPVADIRIGIITIREKWEQYFGGKSSSLTENYLQPKFTALATNDNLMINGALCPDENLVKAIKKLTIGQNLVSGAVVLASRSKTLDLPSATQNIIYDSTYTLIDQPWKIFQHNASELKKDFVLITEGRESIGIQDKHTIVYGAENIFVEDGADIKAAVLNAESGPIYIGKNAVVQEGSLIKGSFALCEGSTVNMGAKMRGDSTIGPHCKVGGEISNSVLFGFSNKGHDGFLGNSVLGEWCNLGADTNTSNLKNNYDQVKLWSYTKRSFVNTGQQFCGLMMGDHSKCGINTMFNTGTVVGVSANIFGDGYPRNFVPSFSWGGASGFIPYQLNKAFETAERVMSRRHIELTQLDKDILKHIFDSTEELKKA
ncbi:glucose-1-phosphate thymidylyltransferase [Chryseotalea sanaruensis]|uniref:Glucose-1-phosphate thymidylyltransferase n=1 Tax=Chryseotalea sanaruensis TaxID=2482724 RepID=A0A401UD80_9BACT|nr:GlmU family protein [Chryseotalea sanaruensis]GCC52833.1 glucose-1-phosphate thymidylyltransferase [Chryseotalea sanaruensis]